MKFKMAATAGLSLTLDPMGKVSQTASSLKPPGQSFNYSLDSVSSLISEKKIFEISANQSIVFALAAMLNIRLERKTETY
jgi:hypothetical protein